MVSPRRRIQLDRRIEMPVPFGERSSRSYGIALRQKAKLEEAISEYRIALRLKPEYAEAENNLGYALYSIGGPERAVVQFRVVTVAARLRLRPLQSRPCAGESHSAPD